MGAVVTETDAAGIIHDAAVVAFDEAEAAVVGVVEYSVTSTVIGVITVVAVCIVVIEREWCESQKRAAVAIDVVATVLH